MKKSIFVLALCSLLFVQAKAQDTIMLFADPHVFATQLFDPNADSFKSMMESQRKMLDISEQVFRQLVDTALKYKPALVLIPGDLTKDGERKSFEVVQEGLYQLMEEGIPSLIVPGNHDIGGKAYQYKGSEPVQLPESDIMNRDYWPAFGGYINIREEHDLHTDWIDQFSGYRSLSYSIRPLPHLTVIGIDASHDDAAQGSIADETLRFILDRADSARAQGDMIIAMCHWQLIDHFDQKSSLEPACRLANADAIRDSLMHHGVHLVLTGHFHVNSISTWRDTTGLTNDSIVELSTGSPITYPNPYRWLILSQDRAKVEVQTDYINEVKNLFVDFPTYSEQWMRVHTHNLIPTLARKAWGKVDAKWDSDVVPALQALGMGALAPTLYKALPQTDSARIALTDKHLGEPAVELYLFHSRANEQEDMFAEDYAQAVYKGMGDMMDDCFKTFAAWGITEVFKVKANEMAEPVVESLVNNTNLWNTKHASITDDLQPRLIINTPVIEWAIDQPLTTNPLPLTEKIILNGNLYLLRNNHLYTPQGQLVE